MTAAPGPVRVVVVEDSPTQRSFLRQALEAKGDIVVVGEAASALNAAAVVQHTKPDLVTMDLDIPGGGVRAISRIMERSPVPILLLTGQSGGPRSPAAVGALAAGAVGVLTKPVRWDEHHQDLLRARVRTLRRVTTAERQLVPGGAPSPVPVTTVVARSETERRSPVIALGASTGGPKAVASVLRGMSPGEFPVLCVQHIDADQVEGLARWLRSSTGWDVRIAADGDRLEPGVVLLGPGGSHIGLSEDERVALRPDTESFHAPSVDHLLLSLAKVCGTRTVACVLTGMGSDGAEGMLAVHRAGGATFAQDEASSVVFGMAGAAVRVGGVRRVIALDALPAAIEHAARSRR